MSEENQNTNGSEKPVNGAEKLGAETSFDVSDEIKKLQEQAEKYKNDGLYLRAEFDNYRRNMIKERSDLLKFGSERLVKDLLSVLDNFERALEAKLTAENMAAFKQGVEMTAADLKNLLQKHGVTEMPTQGHNFDPNLHEALSSEATDKLESGKILRVFQKAYKLHDKLIRPAQVVVAKKIDE